MHEQFFLTRCAVATDTNTISRSFEEHFDNPLKGP